MDNRQKLCSRKGLGGWAEGGGGQGAMWNWVEGLPQKPSSQPSHERADVVSPVDFWRGELSDRATQSEGSRVWRNCMDSRIPRGKMRGGQSSDDKPGVVGSSGSQCK